jgi:hypothetical protein
VHARAGGAQLARQRAYLFRASSDALLRCHAATTPSPRLVPPAATAQVQAADDAKLEVSRLRRERDAAKAVAAAKAVDAATSRSGAGTAAGGAAAADGARAGGGGGGGGGAMPRVPPLEAWRLRAGADQPQGFGATELGQELHDLRTALDEAVSACTHGLATCAGCNARSWAALQHQ